MHGSNAPLLGRIITEEVQFIFSVQLIFLCATISFNATTFTFDRRKKLLLTLPPPETEFRSLFFYVFISIKYIFEQNYEIVNLDGLYFPSKVARIKEGSAPGQVLLQNMVRWGEGPLQQLSLIHI